MSDQRLRLLECVVDLETRRVHSPGGVETLTDRESNVLRFLAVRDGGPAGRDEIWDAVWGPDHAGSPRLIDNIVRRIRTKIEPDPSAPQHLQTVHGIGYRLALPEVFELHAAPAVLPSPLLGRDRELGLVTAALDSSRLVTILGAAGMGKTALARHLMRGRLRSWGRALFVDLSHASSADEITAATAAALGTWYDRGSGGDDDATLRRLLADPTEVVLVLDNFEQVVPHAQATIGAWLEEFRGLRAVVTSREPLRILGEHCVRLAPLDVDAGADLFRRRALETGADGALLDEEMVRAVAQRLECIPLALELAAHLVETLGLDGLLERLDDPLAILDHSGAQRTERHATMTSALEWSWRLLDEDERRALTRASVFRGFDAEALERTGAADLAVLKRLVDKSLVYAEPSRWRSRRFSMYLTVAAFAAERLAERGERSAAIRAHAEYFANWGPSTAALLSSDAWLGALARLNADQDNLVAALANAAELDWEPGARLAFVLDDALSIKGSSALRRQALDLALGLARAPALRGEALLRRANWTLTGADLATVEVLLSEALEATRQAGATALEGRVLVAWASLRHNGGRIPEAESFLERAIAAARACHDIGTEAQALGILGQLRRAEGDLEAARRQIGRARDMSLVAHDLLHATRLAHVLAQVAFEQGDIERARALYAEVREAFSRLEHQRGVAFTRMEEAYLAALSGDVDEAQAALALVERWFGDPTDAARAAVQECRAWVALSAGDQTTARRALHDAATTSLRSGNAQAGLIAEIARGCLLFIGGDGVEALRVLDDAVVSARAHEAWRLADRARAAEVAICAAEGDLDPAHQWLDEYAERTGEPHRSLVRAWLASSAGHGETEAALSGTLAHPQARSWHEVRLLAGELARRTAATHL